MLNVVQLRVAATAAAADLLLHSETQPLTPTHTGQIGSQIDQGCLVFCALVFVCVYLFN